MKLKQHMKSLSVFTGACLMGLLVVLALASMLLVVLPLLLGIDRISHWLSG